MANYKVNKTFTYEGKNYFKNGIVDIGDKKTAQKYISMGVLTPIRKRKAKNGQ